MLSPSRWRTLSLLLPALLLPEPHEAAAGAPRFRRPAPAEDTGEQVEVPVFGAPAGHRGTDRTLHVVEWVAKRTWHGLGLPWERKDFTGPPALRVSHRDGWVEIESTVATGGVPLRNQVVACELWPRDGAPAILLLRSTDAFGELRVELDLTRGRVSARSVTVSRSMLGGRCHSSPMPEQSSSRLVRKARFRPPGTSSPTRLRVRAVGRAVSVRVDDREVLRFDDPDPAGGKFALGSTGRLRVRSIAQWELISPDEERRREACLEEMREFCRKIDALYEGDVRDRNRVVADGGTVEWRWPATGASALLRAEGSRVLATVRSGLYGNPELVRGVFPEIVVSAPDEAGREEELTADPTGTARLEGGDRTLRMTLPLRGASGRRATARVEISLSVQTVWFWRVRVEGVEPSAIRAWIALAPAFAAPERGGRGPAGEPVTTLGVERLARRELLRHDARAGLFLKATEPEHAVLGVSPERPGQLAVATSARELRFATSILPAQPLNPIGFDHRMVHYIRYPEGPIEDWRRRPSSQEYPTDVDLRRYAGEGTDAMVWHHTWIGSDFRDREGFLVNDAEMRRAMDTTHRLGMKAIGYLGIVPGRSSLLRYDDTCPLSGAATYGSYPKNWDLQDQTFYHVAGRYPEFIAWMADHWAREYGLDGFYLDGGAFGLLSRGALEQPLRPEDRDRTLDEIRHLAYWRVRKVLERAGAGYGLEPWSGLDWMLCGFYDCMMIGESFQEASPDYYRDGHNALLTGCTIKMYGMRESSQNPYNIAMAAVNLGDIQVCSGNGAWGDDPDTADTWDRVRPLWRLLDSIDWRRVIEARPWYAQELVEGEGFYAGHYTEPDRVLVFLANRTETPGRFDVRIDPSRLPPIEGRWELRYSLGRRGEIGPLGSGALRVELPALHDGPIGIELLARPAPRAGGFVPSVRGKKLLHFRGPVRGDDEVALDGVITGGPLPFRDRLDREKLLAWAEETAALDHGRHTDNFYLCYSHPGKDAEAFDWFDDLSWVVENWRIMAAAARAAGFRGICFDSEFYEGLPLFGYSSMRHRSTRGIEEYRRRVRHWGAAIQRAVESEFPGMTTLVLFGFSGSFYPVPQHPVSRGERYSLVAAFVDGLLEGCGPGSRIFDMHEQSFSFREPSSFASARALLTEVLPERSASPERFRRHHRVGFSFWADCWGHRGQGRAIDVEDFETNYYTPDEMAWSIHQALAWSDGYVWMWGGDFDWWRRKVRSLDADGKEVERPMPTAYLDALRRARQPDLAPPPRDRRPHFWRVAPASRQEGWGDEETFRELRERHDVIADLPEEWRFLPDPEDRGEREGWHRRPHDDREWAPIRIREFWEMQGYAPLDGSAWYRLRWTPRGGWPEDRRLLLAFGGVADEATVWVDGEMLFASRPGESLRHRVSLVDVTGRLRASREATIAVRVRNTCWCGGIWKSVKLLATRR